MMGIKLSDPKIPGALIVLTVLASVRAFESRDHEYDQSFINSFDNFMDNPVDNDISNYPRVDGTSGYNCTELLTVMEQKSDEILDVLECVGTANSEASRDACSVAKGKFSCISSQVDGISASACDLFNNFSGAMTGVGISNNGNVFSVYSQFLTDNNGIVTYTLTVQGDSNAESSNGSINTHPIDSLLGHSITLDYFTASSNPVFTCRVPLSEKTEILEHMIRVESAVNIAQVVR